MSATIALTACNTSVNEPQTDEPVIGRSDIRIEGKRMTPEALWAMGRIGDISVSPDQQHIAYSVTYYSVTQNKSNSELFVMKADGTEKDAGEADGQGDSKSDAKQAAPKAGSKRRAACRRRRWRARCRKWT